MMVRGRFISLEGIDGAGKSTHHRWLVERLRAMGKSVVATREPGGTELGEKLRALLLSEAMHLETEALLMFAARREHIDKVIEPALRRGDWVVSDRFTDASFAYQGGGRALSTAKLEILERWVQDGLQPDRTFLFDIEPSLARRRLEQTANAPDRFELEQEAFFARVRAAYLERAAAHADRFVVIDAAKGVDEIEVILEKHISSVCI
jgi:dTMP kinase